MTPVLVTDTTGFCVSRRSENCSLRVGDFLMEVVATADVGTADVLLDSRLDLRRARWRRCPMPAPLHPAPLRRCASEPSPEPVALASSSADVFVLLEHGIHARPAATLAAVAKKAQPPISTSSSVTVRRTPKARSL